MLRLSTMPDFKKILENAIDVVVSPLAL